MGKIRCKINNLVKLMNCHLLSHMVPRKKPQYRSSRWIWCTYKMASAECSKIFIVADALTFAQATASTKLCSFFTIPTTEI